MNIISTVFMILTFITFGSLFFITQTPQSIKLTIIIGGIFTVLFLIFDETILDNDNNDDY